jgi:4-hydroxybenzoate polyprenyltransferase
MSAPDATDPVRSGSTNDRATPDAVRGWVDRLPGAVRPYARLARADRPVGGWLLFWPCVWGVALAGGMPRAAHLVPLFLVGAFAMRAAGCVYNDIVDRNLDARVARTRDRPLASGTVGVRGAWALLVALSLVGLAVLVQLAPLARAVALAALLLVAFYPFMKRVTWWPQAWLGLTFNWGVLVGYVAVAGALSPAALALYAAGVFWTLGYDTIYALQDVEDDALAGIRSSARRLGGHVRAGVAGFYAVAFALLVAAHPHWALLPAGAQLAWQVWRLPADPLGLFRSNAWAGALVAVALLA